MEQGYLFSSRWIPLDDEWSKCARWVRREGLVWFRSTRKLMRCVAIEWPGNFATPRVRSPGAPNCSGKPWRLPPSGGSSPPGSGSSSTTCQFKRHQARPREGRTAPKGGRQQWQHPWPFRWPA